MVLKQVPVPVFGTVITVYCKLQKSNLKKNEANKALHTGTPRTRQSLILTHIALPPSESGVMSCAGVAIQAAGCTGAIQETESLELPTCHVSGSDHNSRRIRDKASSGMESYRCQVPGCTVDLRSLSDFNMRCHTCTEHSRADFVSFGDRKYRFCQQCNKYQPLEEFEGKKRGCREKLAIHNSRRVEKRRRNALQRSLATVLAGLGGDKKRNMGTLKKLVAKMRKACVSEAELDALVRECMPGDKSADCTETSPTCSSIGKESCSVTASPGHKQKSAQTTGGNSHSTGNLPVDHEQSGNCSRLVNEPNQQEHSDSKQMEIRPHRPTTHSGESSFPISFRADMGSGMQLHDGSQYAPAANLGNRQPLHSCAIAPDHLLEIRSGMLDQMEEDSIHLCIGPGCVVCSDQRQGACAHASPLDVDMERHCMYRNGYVPGWNRPKRLPLLSHLSEQHILRISMKIDCASPDKLPEDLLERVCSIVEGHQPRGQEGAMGYIRPGCVLLTLDVPLDENGPMDDDEVQRRAVQALLGVGMSWASCSIDLILPRGRVEYAPGKEPSVGLQMRNGPELVMVQMATADKSVQVSVRGWQGQTGCKFLCRLDGRYVDVSVTNTRTVAEDLHYITLMLDSKQDIGLAWIEIVNDDPSAFYISAALPVLISDNAEICSEVCRLMNSAHMLTVSEALGILKDLDEVLGADERGCWDIEACGRLSKVAARCGWAQTLQECIELVTLEIELGDMLAAWPHLLLYSIQSGDIGTVAQVVSCFVTSRTPLPLARHDALGFTPLHWAALVGNSDIIHLIRAFDTEGQWDSCSALREPYLTPAVILEKPPVSISPPVNATSTRPLSPPKAPPPHSSHPPPYHSTPALINFFPCPGFLIFPLLFLISLNSSEQRNDWRSSLGIALLGVLAEYLARFVVPRTQDILQHLLLARHPELVGYFGASSGSFCFDDPVLSRRYLAYWHSCVVLYDRLILSAFLLKLMAYSYKVRSTWLLTWSSPALALLVSRCLVRQGARHQELANLALGAYSWLCFWVGSLVELSGGLTSLNDGLSFRACLSSAASVAFLSLQYATVYPFRMEQRKWASLISCMAAYIGLQSRLLMSPEFWEGGAVQCALHSLAYAVLPTFFGYIGSEIGCTLVENSRIQRFAATLQKSG